MFQPTGLGWSTAEWAVFRAKAWQTSGHRVAFSAVTIRPLVSKNPWFLTLVLSEFVKLLEAMTGVLLKFTPFGDWPGTKPSNFTLLRDTHGPTPSKFIGFEEFHSPSPPTM